jgi:hypothetical protein
MPYRPFLERIRHLFKTGADEHLERLSEAFSKGALTPPVRPMSDRELARAIREFQARPVSESSVGRLANRFEGGSGKGRA